MQELSRRFLWTVRRVPNPPGYPPPNWGNRSRGNDSAYACTVLFAVWIVCGLLICTLVEMEELLDADWLDEATGAEPSSSHVDSGNLQRQVEDSWYQLNNGNNIDLPWEQGYWKVFFNGDFQSNQPLVHSSVQYQFR